MNADQAEMRERIEPTPLADEDEAEHPATPDNNFVLCLGVICSHFDLPFNASAAMAELPSSDGQFDPSDFVRAAAACGLSARLRRSRPSRVQTLFVPFVVFLKDGGALVVEAIDRFRGIAQVALPTDEGSTPLRRRVPLKQLDFESSRHVAYVTPDRAASGEETDAIDTGFAAGNLLWRVMGAYWPSWVLVVIAAASVNVLGLAVPLFIRSVYDRVLPNFALPTLWALTAGVVIALGFDAILKQFRSQLLDRTGNRIDMRISADLFAHVLRVRLDRFPPGVGGLANTIREIETVRDFFTSASLIATTDLLFIGVFLIVIWMIAGPLALVPAAAVLVVLAVTLLTRYPIAAAIRESTGHVTQRQSLLVESLTGLEALRLAGAEGKRQHAWERAVAAASSGSSRARFWASFANVTTSFVLQMVAVLVIVWGVFLVLDGRITIGALIAASILSGRVLQPLSNIVQTLARSGQAFQAMARIKALLALPRETGIEAGGATVSRGSVEFRKVGFGYPGSDKPALRDLSFTIEPGERVGLIGAVGSGKSTLGKLIAGLYDATEGTVLVDDRDIRQYPRAALRDAVSCSGQDATLFSGSLRDNIALGGMAPTEADIEEAAELAGVTSFARLLPQGLATMVAERGTNLSGGQRQAVALARSFLRRPRVVFLDEPTSAMDAAREAEFLARLDTFCKRDRTLIVATHKASILALVDRVLVLDNGRLALAGQRDEVLAELQKMQRTGARLEQKK